MKSAETSDLSIVRLNSTIWLAKSRRNVETPWLEVMWSSLVQLSFLCKDKLERDKQTLLALQSQQVSVFVIKEKQFIRTMVTTMAAPENRNRSNFWQLINTSILKLWKHGDIDKNLVDTLLFGNMNKNAKSHAVFYITQNTVLFAAHKIRHKK